MRVLFTVLDRGVPMGGTGGNSVRLEELAHAMEQDGHEIGVLARWFLSPPDGSWTDQRPSFHTKRRRGLGRIPVGPSLRKAIKELGQGGVLRRAVRDAIKSFRPDVVYDSYALFRVEAIEEAHRAGLPVVLEVNASLVFEETRFRGGVGFPRIASGRERRAWTSADLVAVVSRPLARLARDMGQDRVIVVPNAVDLDRFVPRSDGQAVRSRLGLENRFVVGFAGSIKEWHDLDTVVDAVSLLPTEVRPALLLVGDGPVRSRLEERAASRGVLLRTSGVVPHADVPEYLSAMDACVVGFLPDPSLHYFSPVKALEYLAAGRPTVVASAGDLADIAQAGVALSYRPGDSSSLGRALQALAADPGLRSGLACGGRTYAESWTWREAARTILDSIQHIPSRSLLGGRSRVDN
jgi:glycosyltransferase involved in cell wall biosynthesis